MADPSPPPSNEVISSEETLDESSPNEHRPSRLKKRKRSSARILSGLDESCVITISDEENDTEESSKGAIPTPSPTQLRKRRITRQAIHGRAEALYNQKYHPMDEVTRPKNAARHRGQSIKVAPESEAGASMPEFPSESDEDAQDERPVRAGRKIFRKGTRHSTRRAAKNRPFYDRSKHPQDEFLNLSDEMSRTKRRPQKKPKPKPVYVEDSASTQSVIHVQTYDPDSESEEEFTIHDALNNGREQVLSKNTSVGEIADSTSGLGEEVSPSEDLLSSARRKSQPRSLSLSDEVCLPEHDSDNYHSEHPRLLDDTQFPAVADSPGPDNSSVLNEGAKQNSDLTEEMATSYNNDVPAGKEPTLVTRAVSQVPSFYFSSQASVGQKRTNYVTIAEQRRRAGNFAIFQDDEDPSQTMPVLIARFYEFDNHDQENRPPANEQRPAAEEEDDLPEARRELRSTNNSSQSPFDTQDEGPHFSSGHLPSETASGIDAAVDFLAASFPDTHSKNCKDSARDVLDMVVSPGDDLEQLNSGSTACENESPNNRNCTRIQSEEKSAETNLQPTDAEDDGAVKMTAEDTGLLSNLDARGLAGSDVIPEIARCGSPASSNNKNVEKESVDEKMMHIPPFHKSCLEVLDLSWTPRS